MNQTTSNVEIDPKLFERASLPDVEDVVVAMDRVSTDDRSMIESLMSEITISDTNSIIFFGAKAQEQLTEISDNMLEGVRNKDVGGAGAALNEMVATLRGFDSEGLKKPGFFAWLFGRAKPVVKFLQQYEKVSKQIDTITDDLEGHKTKLLTDIVSLDRLYDANLDYFHELELYIAAGDEKLKQVDQEVIPAKEKEVAASGDTLKAQELRDLRSARDDLERRIHDLRLTRQVTMQSLPSIRIVQENDKGLVTKINSTLVNTVPLWRQQLATSVTIFRSQEATESVEAASDLTNDLLEKNAEMLKTANEETRRQIERGVFDIEAVKKANRTLIETIEDSLRIANEGKRLRAEALVELQKAEDELHQTLSAATARAESQSAEA
jgi:uncharacterized protein YaaN involved in tellurite resistance